MLADFDEPLVLADGTKIDPGSGKVIKDRRASSFVEIPNASQAQAIVAKTRRAVGELPVPPQQMNGLSLVLFYSMWGLGDVDIATTLGLSTAQVKNMKALPEYVTISNDIRKAVLEHEAGDIRNYIQQHSRSAAEKVIETMEEEGVLGFKAAQDILDRAGHRPADIVEHRHKIEDTLKIEYVERQPLSAIPVLDAEFIVIKGND